MAVFTAMIMILIMLPLAFFFVLTAGEIGRITKQRSGRVSQARPSPPAPPSLDAAEQELRLRYARGEIDREEFLQRKIDLER